MIKKFLISITILLFSVTCLCADVPDISLNYISKAACRVSAGNNRGSGVAIHQDEKFVYILTNAHVIERNNTASVEFYRYGIKSLPIGGTIRGKALSLDRDFAVIVVDKNKFGKTMPEIIPLIPSNYVIKPNTYFATAGNPFSRDMTAREGIIKRVEGVRIIITPPPDNGQSGSGLFIKIGEKVYTAGIITYKSGDYTMDNKGYPITEGVALNVNQLRRNMQGTSYYNGMLYPTFQQLYALGNDGRYYAQRADGGVMVPEGVQIRRWNCPSGDCPPSQMQPLPRPVAPAPRTTAPPQTPNNNPFPDFPDGFAEEPETEAPKVEPTEDYKLKYDELKIQYDELKDKYDKLIVEVDALKEKLTEKENSVTELQKKIDEELIPKLNLEIYLTEISNLKETIENKSVQITEYSTQIQSLQNQINLYTQQIQQEQQNIQQIQQQPKESLWSKTKKFAGNLNPLWYLLLGAGGAFVFGKYIPLLPLITSAFSKKQQVEQVLKDHPEYKDLLKWLDERLIKNDSKLNALIDYVKAKTSNEDNNSVVNNINIDNSSDNDTLDLKGLYKGRPASDRIKNFFDLKKKDGESVEQWAIFAILYREAVQLLRRGRFDVDVVGNKVQLQGQKIAADHIDNWVREQYLKRSNIEVLDFNYLYHEAMIGFLYKEAVKLLRTGFFPILGFKETADTVENWVRKEFLERMGIVM